MWYTYGIDGVCGMTVKENGQTKDYLFDKNAQGDVTHIYTVENNALNLAASYVYDAWGTHKVLTPAGAESADPAFIGNANPFRYRSYYYDEETGLYYLNARYYDPETGRFISSDTPEVLTATADYPNGLNLFAYCLNNPIMEVDPSGRVFLTLLVGFLIGAVVGAAASVVTQYLTKREINGWQVLSDSLFGAVGGLLTATGIGIVGQALIGGAMGMAQYMVDGAITHEEITVGGALLNFGVGLILGGLGGDGLKYGHVKAINGIERQVIGGFKKSFLKGVTAIKQHMLKQFIKPLKNDLVKAGIINASINVALFYGENLRRLLYA